MKWSCVLLQSVGVAGEVALEVARQAEDEQVGVVLVGRRPPDDRDHRAVGRVDPRLVVAATPGARGRAPGRAPAGRRSARPRIEKSWSISVMTPTS